MIKQEIHTIGTFLLHYAKSTLYTIAILCFILTWTIHANWDRVEDISYKLAYDDPLLFEIDICTSCEEDTSICWENNTLEIQANIFSILEIEAKLLQTSITLWNRTVEFSEDVLITPGETFVQIDKNIPNLFADGLQRPEFLPISITMSASWALISQIVEPGLDVFVQQNKLSQEQKENIMTNIRSEEFSITFEDKIQLFSTSSHVVNTRLFIWKDALRYTVWYKYLWRPWYYDIIDITNNEKIENQWIVNVEKFMFNSNAIYKPFPLGFKYSTTVDCPCQQDQVCDETCLEDPDCDYVCGQGDGTCTAQDKDISTEDFDTREACEQDPSCRWCNPDSYCNIDCPADADCNCSITDEQSQYYIPLDSAYYAQHCPYRCDIGDGWCVPDRTGEHATQQVCTSSTNCIIPDPGCNPENYHQWSPVFPSVCEVNPPCSYIQSPAIQTNEILPLRWDLWLHSNIDTIRTCTASNINKIPVTSLMCTFSIVNSDGTQGNITVPCIQENEQWQDLSTSSVSTLESTLLTQMAEDMQNQTYILEETLGRGYLILENLIENIDTLGIYRIQLTAVSYDECMGNNGNYDFVNKEYTWNICHIDVAVSRPFSLHTTALDTKTSSTLQQYKYLNGDTLTQDTSYLTIDTSSLAEWETVTYNNKSVRESAEEILNEYASKAKNLVQNRNSLPFAIQNQDLRIFKVPNQEVYLYDGRTQWNTWVIRITESWPTQAYTLLVKNARLIIDGNFSSNAMFVIPDGNVIFDNIDTCDDTTYVQGIFISGYWFSSPKIQNTHLDHDTWCNKGMVVIKGQLIWPTGDGTQPFGTNIGARSEISSWTTWTPERNDILYGASIRVETNARPRTSNIPWIRFLSDTISTARE